MASKKIIPSSTMIEASFARIVWNPVRNECRAKESKQLPTLTESLSYGWQISQGIVLAQVASDVQKATGYDFVADELQKRQFRWDELKADKSADGPVKLKVFEQIYTDKGELVVPDLIGNACFQRGSVLFDAMVMSFKRAGTFNAVVPVAVRHYASETDRLLDQLRENEGKDVGRETISNNDRLRMGKRLFDLGHIEHFFRLEFSSSTTGQKVYKLCKIDSMYPTVRVLQRIQTEPATEGHIPYGPIKQQDLTDLIRQSDVKLLKPGETVIGLTEVEAFFDNVGKKVGNDPKMMEKSAIQGLKDNNANPAVRLVGKAIIENNLDNIVPLVDISEGTQLLLDARLMSILPSAIAALKVVVDAERARRNPTNPFQNKGNPSARPEDDEKTPSEQSTTPTAGN